MSSFDLPSFTEYFLLETGIDLVPYVADYYANFVVTPEADKEMIKKAYIIYINLDPAILDYPLSKVTEWVNSHFAEQYSVNMNDPLFRVLTNKDRHKRTIMGLVRDGLVAKYS